MNESPAATVSTSGVERREFEMTEAQLARLLDAMKPQPYMIFDGMGPRWGPTLHFDHDSEFPGEVVCIWAGLPDENPQVFDGLLSMLNDGRPHRGIRRRTFAEIADAIEAQL